MKKSYSETLLDPRWQKKRLKILERDGFKCTSCEDDKTTLHVHHRYYVKGRDGWEYPDWSLITLCAPCHSCVGERIPEEEFYLEEWEMAVEFLSGGLPGSISLLWDLGAEISMARNDRGIGHGAVLDELVKRLRKDRMACSPSTPQ